MRDAGVNGIGPAGCLRKEVKVVRGRSKTSVLVIKYNENDNLPCCGERISINNAGWCGVVVIVAEGKNTARTWLFKG